VSRQISGLEHELKVPLFHRYARGLILTEHGDHLFAAAREIRMRLDAACARLSETSEHPEGDLKVTTTVGLGSLWLSRRMGEFLDRYPDVRVELILTNDDLDLAMREAHVALWLRQPTQPDLIQRRLFTVHFHAYASPNYIERFGEPRSLEDLDQHRLVAFGGDQPAYLQAAHWLSTASREFSAPRPYHFVTNTHLALKPALEAGCGIGVLPDYAADGSKLVRVLREIEMPSLESYFVYPEEARSVARVQAFRDFLVAKAQRWAY
jgi:DNA-binding transcriptional LysR family regulator